MGGKPIPILFATEKRTAQGEVINLSKRGLFIRTLDLPAPGESVRVTLKSRQGTKFEVEGEVRWTTDQLEQGRRRSSGFGLVFTGWNEAYSDFFEQLLFLAQET